MKSARNACARHLVHSLGLIGLAGQHKFAAIGCVQTRDDIEKSGFARAIGADQAINLATANLHMHIGQRLQAAKGSVFGSGCNSWYLDRNGVPNTWPWSQSRFRQDMSAPVWQDYIHHQTEELVA